MTSTIDTVAPHVADKIEPGAVLYSSWGYEQTNIDYYYVTRCTAKSVWLVKMTQTSEGAGFMSENVMPKAPVFFSKCECRHFLTGHQSDGPCHMHGCDCTEIRPVAVTPKMRRIQRSGDREFVRMASYANAYLWDGASNYATHYA